MFIVKFGWISLDSTNSKDMDATVNKISCESNAPNGMKNEDDENEQLNLSRIMIHHEHKELKDVYGSLER